MIYLTDEDLEGDESPSECPYCGSTETIEISDEHQSILVCEGCGAD